MNAPAKFDPEGWIVHDGSGCPLPYETLVHVMIHDRRHGNMADPQATFAGFWHSHGPNRWRRCHDWWIVAYKLADNPLADVIHLAPGRIAA